MKQTGVFIILVVASAICGCGKKSSPKSGVAKVDELNQAFSIMSMGGKGPPASVTDLTNFPTIQGKSLPSPPAGKKLVIDRSRSQVVFADQ